MQNVKLSNTSRFIRSFLHSAGPGSGVSVDYGYGTLGIKYTYVVQLRDEGRYGFMLPESEIQPSGEETFEALKVFGTSDLN